MCPSSGISYPVPEPNSFSFNSPKGMCPKCNGLGHHFEISLDKIIPNDQLSIEEGGIDPLGKKKASWAFKQVEAIALKYNFDLSTPISKIQIILGIPIAVQADLQEDRLLLLQHQWHHYLLALIQVDLSVNQHHLQELLDLNLHMEVVLVMEL